MTTTIFGRKLSIPVMASSLSGTAASMGRCIDEMTFATSILQGSVDAGSMGLIGNTCDTGQETTGIKALRTVGTGIPIFKPQANTRLLELIAMAALPRALSSCQDR